MSVYMSHFIKLEFYFITQFTNFIVLFAYTCNQTYGSLVPQAFAQLPVACSMVKQERAWYISSRQ